MSNTAHKPMNTTQARKLGYYAIERREEIGTRMGGLGKRLEIAIIRATWEVYREGVKTPVITGAKTRKQAFAMLDQSIRPLA
jgi:hypothetical protein